MKILFQLLTVLWLCSCSNSSKVKTEVSDNDTSQISSKNVSHESINIEFIKMNSQKRQTIFTVPTSGKPLQSIPDTLLEKYIFHLPVRNLPDYTIPQDAYGLFFLGEYWESENIFFFTFVYIDESCCRNVYGITVNKKDGAIIQTALLGLNGSDGGWNEADQGKWVNDTTLRVVKAQSYDDLDLTGKITIDTTWLEINYNQKGYFQQVKLDSAHYEQTKN